MSCFKKIPGRIDGSLNRGNNGGNGDDGTSITVVRST